MCTCNNNSYTKHVPYIMSTHVYCEGYIAHAARISHTLHRMSALKL